MGLKIKTGIKSVTTGRVVSVQEWHQLLATARQSPVETPGPEWKSVPQLLEESLAAGLKCEKSTLKHRMVGLVRRPNSPVERKKFRVELPSGKLQSVWHYRIIEPAKNKS
jgi:hypothetical protein